MPKKEVKNNNRMGFKGKNLVAQYLKAKEDRDSRLWTLVGKRLVTFFKGEYITADEFDKRNPILCQSSLFLNKENPNVRRNYSV